MEKENRGFRMSGETRDHEPIKGTEHTVIPNVRNEFLDVLVSSVLIYKRLRAARLSNSRNKQTKNLESRMNTLYNDMIRCNILRQLDDVVALAQAYLYMSFVYTRNETDTKRITIGDEYLARCLELLKGNRLRWKTVLITQKVLNEIATTSLLLNNTDAAVTYLQRAHDINMAYIRGRNDHRTPFDITSILGNEENSKASFEYRNYLILYRLANIYANKTNLDKSVIIYMYITLNNNLHRVLRVLNTECMTWVITSMEASELLLLFGCLEEARYCLAAAHCLMCRFNYEVIIKNINVETATYTPYYQYYEDTSIAMLRCWAKYAIQLLHLSKDSLLQSEEGTILYETSDPDVRSVLELATFKFSSLEKYVPRFFMIEDKCPLNCESAKILFHKVISWLKIIQHHYSDNNWQQYARTAQDMSKAYEYIAYYEMDGKEQIIMHKHRIRILMDVLRLLDSETYTDICREIWIELAVICSTILEIYFESVRTSVAITTETQMEVDNIARHSIHFFKLYTDSVVDTA